VEEDPFASGHRQGLGSSGSSGTVFQLLQRLPHCEVLLQSVLLFPVPGAGAPSPRLHTAARSGRRPPFPSVQAGTAALAGAWSPGLLVWPLQPPEVACEGCNAAGPSLQLPRGSGATLHLCPVHGVHPTALVVTTAR
jgi:hypothetical protein